MRRLTTVVRTSFAPDRARRALETLAGIGPAAELPLKKASDEFLRVLAELLSISSPMQDSLFRHPDWISWLAGRIEESPTRGELGRAYDEQPPRAVEGESAVSRLDRLRALKRREYLEIAYRDIAGHWSLEETTHQLSKLAEYVIANALSHCRDALIDERPESLKSETDPAAGFAVLAMGKLGGLELNYSSDVDLVFVRRASSDPEELRYFTRLGEKLVQSLSQAGPDGFLYRVDMRLRPYGETGPLVPSLPSLINYYESWGEAWERQALIKARFICGAEDLGKRFTDFVANFTFARQMDDSSLEEIKRVKHRSEKEYSQSGSRVNLKQGPGGIRDVEFYVQYLQLIAGGEHPEVRSKSTLEAIRGLGEAKLLLEGEESLLSLAYRLFRVVEHRLQLRNLTPQALLPEDRQEMKLLANGLGFSEEGDRAAETFGKVLGDYRSRVRTSLERIYLAPGYLHVREREEELAQLLSDRTPRERVRELLSHYGFQDVEKAWQNLRLLALGPAGRILPPGERRSFLGFAFTLLEVVKDSLDPDLALHHLESLATASGNRVSFLRALTSKRSHLYRLSNLLAHSSLCQQVLTRHPEFFDTLARGGHLLEQRDWRDLLREIRDRMDLSPPGELKEDVLRKLRQREMVRIAYRDLAGFAGALEISRELSELAEACVQAGADLSASAMKEEEGSRPLIAVALGKLGSRQLHYSSDLDLMFVYGDLEDDAPAEERARVQRAMDARVERILHLVSSVTREGLVYSVDLRLRPEGASGLLARSKQSFLTYAREFMQPWERMALVRSRLLDATPDEQKWWDRVLAEVVYEFPWDGDSREAIRHLKRRIEREKNKESRSHVDFKYGRGGIADLEFLVQFLQLQYGTGDPSVRVPSVGQAVPALRRAGAISEEEAGLILEAHHFQRLLENRYQLMEEWSSREISRESPQLARLSKCVGMRPGGKGGGVGAFLPEWEEHAGNVRKLVEKYFYG